jgi:lysophospholipid acyltransferase (LPLAT)-like uncharacterized protein
MRPKDLWVPMAAFMAFLMIKVLSWTWRIRFYPEDCLERAAKLDDGAYLAAVWHENNMAAMFCHLNVQGATLVSRRNAGQILSLTIKRFGWDSIRGSRKKGGKEARDAMISYLQSNKRPVALTVDGASGPRRRTKPGILNVALKTGVPIIPVVGLANRYWVVKNSWDQMRVPKPFAILVCAYGEPKFPPKDLKGPEFDRYLIEIDKDLNKLEHDVAAQHGFLLPPLAPDLLQASEADS